MKSNNKTFLLSIQHAFAMFGSSILIPLIMGIDPSLVLITNGLITILFIYLTKGSSPAFLGSSGTFLAPALVVIASKDYGFPYALGAFFISGILGCIFAYIFKKWGTSFIDIILPPAAMGPVVALIGFDLIKYSINGGRIGANFSNTNDVIIFAITLITVILSAVIFKGLLSTIPILLAIIVGYICSIFLGMVDFSNIYNANIISFPTLTAPKFAIIPIITIIPAVFVLLTEHISHQVVTGSIMNKDLLKEPGLSKTLFANSLGISLASLVGSIPTTTYGENIGVMAITKIFSTRALIGASIISIAMGLSGKLSALITTIPGAVIGGVSFLLYGMIGTTGIRLLVDKKVNYDNSKNLILTSIVFVVGLSGLRLNLFGVELTGMTLACLIAIIISLVFNLLDRLENKN